MSKLGKRGSGIGIIGQRVDSTLLERAKEMRRKSTPEEAEIWSYLRANKLGGLHFRRQQVIHGYIVDFACDAAKLVVELDGAPHANVVEADQERDENLRSLGFTVLRFKNDEVSRDPEYVLRKILKATELDRVATTPLPARGGDGGRGDSLTGADVRKRGNEGSTP